MRGWSKLLLALILCLAGAVRADDVVYTTDLPDPSGRYGRAAARNLLRVGSPSNPGNTTLYGDLVIDKRTGSDGATAGGTLVLTGDLDVRAFPNTNLLFVDSGADGVGRGRVGIGTSTPSEALEVVGGPIRSVNIQAYANVDAGSAGFLELYGARDAMESSPLDDRVGAVCFAPGGPEDYDLLPLYIDGNPLVLQGTVKPGVTQAGGRGHVVIKGEPIGSPIWGTGAAATLPAAERPNANTVLVVGFPGFGSVIANVVPPSSSAFKKDIRPLTPSEYAEAAAGLQQFTVARFHYRDQEPTEPLRFGLIAEEVPPMIREQGSVSLDGTYGFLYAALKGLRQEQKGLRERVEALQR